MAELVLGTATLKVEEFTRLPDEVGGARGVRAVNGQLRSDVDWTKRAWATTVLALDDAEAVAVRAAVAPATVVMSGDRPGGSFTVSVEIGDDAHVVLGNTVYRRLALVLREV